MSLYNFILTQFPPKTTSFMRFFLISELILILIIGQISGSTLEVLSYYTQPQSYMKITPHPIFFPIVDTPPCGCCKR